MTAWKQASDDTGGLAPSHHSLSYCQVLRCLQQSVADITLLLVATQFANARMFCIQHLYATLLLVSESPLASRMLPHSLAEHMQRVAGVQADVR